MNHTNQAIKMHQKFARLLWATAMSDSIWRFINSAYFTTTVLLLCLHTTTLIFVSHNISVLGSDIPTPELQHTVKRSHVLRYRGKRSIDYPAQGNPYTLVYCTNNLPPSERRDIWGAGIVYGRTRWSARFDSWETREKYVCSRAHAQALLLWKKRSKWDSNPCLRRCQNAKILPTESYRGELSIDYAAQGKSLLQSPRKVRQINAGVKGIWKKAETHPTVGRGLHFLGQHFLAGWARQKSNSRLVWPCYFSCTPCVLGL